MLNRRDFLYSAAAALAAARAASASSQPAASHAQTPGLKDLACSRECLVGAVADRWQMQDDRWLQLILDNFNLITLGKLKWSFLRPDPTTLNFDEPDWMVAFCRQHHLAMHGHNLCWNAGDPAWLSHMLTPSNAARILTDHITLVMRRYAGSITSWDIVNEPIATWLGRPDGLYTGPWLTALGPEYIDIAFHAAAAADPSALRVLNLEHVEQGGAGDDAARTLTLRLIESLLHRNVPIQAIGLESHLYGDLPTGSISARAAFLRELLRFGLQVLITELDINDTRLPLDISRNDALVAQAYRDYLTCVLEEAQPPRVIFFSPADQRNWYDADTGATYARPGRAPHRPGLFDRNLAPKPAYAAVARTFQGAPA